MGLQPRLCRFSTTALDVISRLGARLCSTTYNYRPVPRGTAAPAPGLLEPVAEGHGEYKKRREKCRMSVEEALGMYDMHEE